MNPSIRRSIAAESQGDFTYTIISRIRFLSDLEALRSDTMMQHSAPINTSKSDALVAAEYVSHTIVALDLSML